MGKSFEYTYDRGGNILSEKEYAYTVGTLGSVLNTKTYTYGDSNWKDKLTGYAGSTITYDNIGNPLVYRDGMSFTWQNGRELATSSIGGVTTSYTYNSSGIRTSKTVGSVKTSYVLDGDRVAKSKTGDVWTFYYYDETGSPIAFRTNETGTAADYYYVKNLQGDIVAIANASGSKAAEYTYDAWGKVLSVTGSLANSIGASNPYRYRGYWYDTETGLYYLQSRYYDPTTGRFINADSKISGINGSVYGYNLFEYCNNNPNSNIDPNGDWPQWLETATKIVAAAVLVTAVVLTAMAVTAATAGAAAPVSMATAAVLLGGATSGINGGLASESKGGSFVNGYVGGFAGGAVQSSKLFPKKSNNIKGCVGVFISSVVTDVMSNIDPDCTQKKGASDIITDAFAVIPKAFVANGVTTFIHNSSDAAVSNQAYGLMPGYSKEFGEGVKAFFSWVDDAIVNIW